MGIEQNSMVAEHAAHADSIDIGDLEYAVGPSGSSEAVGAAPCAVAIIWVFIYASN